MHIELYSSSVKWLLLLLLLLYNLLVDVPVFFHLIGVYLCPGPDKSTRRRS